MKIASYLVALVLAALASSTASAGDTPEVNVLGFSADGKVFAFEEYGIQDGSGFPFANRFYIETETDKFVAGTPIRVRIDDEQASLETARAQARDRGQAILADAELTENRGLTAGWNPITELSADPHRMTVIPRLIVPPLDNPIEFRLHEIPYPLPERCENLGETMAFGLMRIALLPDERTRTVYEDTTIPQSRGCPLGYRIGGIQTFYPYEHPPVYAVLIAVRSFGFEGPNHRWIAVTGRLF